MLPTSPCIKLIMFCILTAACHGYYIDVTVCKQNRLYPIQEDSGAGFPCMRTNDDMKWEMYNHINTTHSGWQIIATCSPSDCTNLQENLYVATRPTSSASILQILRAGRDSLGDAIRCSSLSGNTSDFCYLSLYYEATPSDCRMELDKADGGVTLTASCVISKFYFRYEYPSTCLWHQYHGTEFDPYHITGKLNYSVVVDRVTGREYGNGTCSVSTGLGGNGLYRYETGISGYTRGRIPPVYTLQFVLELTTTLSPVLSSVQTSQQTAGGTTGGTASTETPPGPEKATLPAPGDGTGGGGNTADSGDKFTVLYALVGVCIVLLIVIIIAVTLVVWRKARKAADHLSVCNGSGSSSTTVTSGLDENHYAVPISPFSRTV